ncbi:uncharacterized membrane protein At4g09580-like [Hordeum vulgare subsp. vulgare]|uniref:uncharacterized membrane protein At4g09580-like n=1 Tax=Hordeum vulgare subsp. vulgare TaxID=112509 RepID=UPI001D1A59DD|nr:uncharacterized membrane protein At4g09580-like [Hordeum vulgare subsp. vulgare]
MGREDRFPLWEAALGAGVAAAFAAGLVEVYLSMPDSDYSFLKLPRNLHELQILTKPVRIELIVIWLISDGATQKNHNSSETRGRTCATLYQI